jgi:hypothetical protein
MHYFVFILTWINKQFTISLRLFRNVLIIFRVSFKNVLGLHASVLAVAEVAPLYCKVKAYAGDSHKLS